MSKGWGEIMHQCFKYLARPPPTGVSDNKKFHDGWFYCFLFNLQKLMLRLGLVCHPQLDAFKKTLLKSLEGDCGDSAAVSVHIT